jgi:hypothetical protein
VIRSHVDFLSRALVMAKGGTPIIDLTSHSSDEEGGSSKKHKLVPESKGTACEPPSKRLRAGEASGGPSDSKPGLPKHVPFELIWVRYVAGLEMAAQHGIGKPADVLALNSWQLATRCMSHCK